MASDREVRMLECFRQWTGKGDCRLAVEYRAGVWEISRSTAAAHARDAPFRGFGATFNEAWDNMNPRWADQIPKSPSVGRTLRQRTRRRIEGGSIRGMAKVTRSRE